MPGPLILVAALFALAALIWLGAKALENAIGHEIVRETEECEKVDPPR